MIIKARKRFLSHLGKIKNVDLLNETEFIIDEAIKNNKPENIPGFKWLVGYTNLGRIRIENYRIGVRVDGNTLICICMMHKEEFYSFFP